MQKGDSQMVVQKLVAIRDRTIREFTGIMEFKAVTQLAYKVGAEFGQSEPRANFRIGYSQFAGSIGLADKDFSASELVSEFQGAEDEYLLSFVLQHQVAIFENLFFDILKALLFDHPVRLPKDRQIEYSTILNAATRDDIIVELVDREINYLRYKPVRDWFSYLERQVSKCAVPPDLVARIAEVKATRDLLVHNDGKVNLTYVRKAEPYARAKIGETISVGGLYTRDVWQLLSSVTLMILDFLAAEIGTSSATADRE
jgi:hypothetical protein